MRYGFPQYFESKSRFLTYQVVYVALVKAGNEVVNSVTDCDAVLFSMCDVMDYKGLVKLRSTTDKPIIVGGSYAFNYWSAILHSDAVWIGEVYEMADCRSLDELMQSPHCYVRGKTDALYAAQKIRWEEVPVCQIAPKKAYYWGGVGCKNHCQFCFTSWTHAHIHNSDARIKASKELAKKHGIHLNICSNEYDKGNGGKTQDMLLRDYIKTPVKGANFIRCGIEFATEESRKRMGKPITKEEIYKALQKGNAEKVSFRFFHIAGHDTLNDWETYISDLCAMLDRVQNGRLLHLMFNNLQYQNYTPLYDRRHEIDPSRYIDVRKTREWYDRLRQHSQHILIGAPSPFQHVACRMGVELAQTKEQLDFWLRMTTNAKEKMSVQQAYDSLMQSGVLDCERRIFNPITGEIRVLQNGK